MKSKGIDPKTTIGHIHLKVADIDRALQFYRDILGFDVMQRIGNEAAFLSAGGYHHHIALNTWETHAESKPAPSESTGLYHFAILLPSRKALAEVVKRVLDAKYPLSGAADHGVSEAIYLADPDGNGIELYCDRPKKEWPLDTEGNPLMYTRRLDVGKLLAEAV